MAGSIEKRSENTYRLLVSGGKNLDGNSCKKTKTIHGTRKDAEIALAEFITEVNRGLVPEGKSITFEEFFYIKYKAAILLDIFSGVRRGELIGLEWSDVDFKNETININKSTQYLPEN